MSSMRSPFAPLAQRRAARARRAAAALLLCASLALPELAYAGDPPTGKSLDAMSSAELERFVQQLNEDANWRRYRRPGDPPDFVPGKPVKLTHGAGSAFGRGGGIRGGSFRRGGLSRRSGLSSRRRGRDDAMAADGGRSSRSGLGSSSRSRSSSFGSSSFGSSRSGIGSSQRVEQGDTGF
jgi:hypothetical protein